MGRMEVFTGPERRRRWSDEEKLRILEEAAQPGVSAASVARRHDLLPQQVYAWRRRYRVPDLSRTEDLSFLPVMVTDETPPLAEPASVKASRSTGRVEVVCRNGRIVKVGSSFDVDRLQAVIRAVESA